MGVFLEKIGAVSKLVSELIEKQNCVGFSIGVINQNKVVMSESYGRLSINGDKTCNNQSLFCIGSLSKSFTSLAILILAEQDRLSIEDPVSKYMPLELDGKEDEIKLKHLMSHSSGLPNIHICAIIEKKLGERPDYNGVDFGKEVNSWEGLFQYVNDHSKYITSKPGERFHYSDASFSLLGYVIEKVSGISYGHFLRKYIFNPLEMKNTTIRSEFADDGNATYGHLSDKQTKGNGIVSTYQNYPISELVDGGGGVMASNQDLQNFMLMMMNYGAFRDKRLISLDSYKQLITPVVEVNRTRGISCGLGWLLLKSKGKLFVFHPGNTGASATFFGFFVEEKFGMFITNNINHPPLPIYFEIMKNIYDGEFNIPPNDLLSISGKDFVGKYHGIGNIEHLEIENLRGDLYVNLLLVDVYGVENRHKSLHYSNDEYYIVEGNEKTKIYLETIDDEQWVTIGINKYRKMT